MVNNIHLECLHRQTLFLILIEYQPCVRASLVAQMVKNLPAMWETWFDPWVGKIPWRRAWQHIPVLLPGESPWTKEPGGLQSMGFQRVGHY